MRRCVSHRHIPTNGVQDKTTQQERRAQISVPVDADLRAAIERAAQAEHRTVAAPTALERTRGRAGARLVQRKPQASAHPSRTSPGAQDSSRRGWGARAGPSRVNASTHRVRMPSRLPINVTGGAGCDSFGRMAASVASGEGGPGGRCSAEARAPERTRDLDRDEVLGEP